METVCILMCVYFLALIVYTVACKYALLPDKRLLMLSQNSQSGVTIHFIHLLH